MKISLFILSFLAAFATAGGMAGGYERMFLWYAYRMSVKANGASNNKIAKNCRGRIPPMDPEEGPPNPCSFNEFIQYIDGTSRTTYVRTADLEPDVTTIGERLGNRNGGKGIPTLDTQRIAGVGGYGKLMRLASDIVSSASSNKKHDFTRELERATQALNYVSKYRQKDFEWFRIKALNEEFRPKGVVIKASNLDFRGMSFVRYDPVKTISDNPKTKIEDLQKELEKFDNEYLRGEDSDSHKHTMDVVDEANAYINRPTACSAPR
ncbi:hypothetical protein V492_00070 [Pseudogymnoascus sp. VKM F-4246]|nr:hypothetical protein V492_00070 [Pseudogymnoascus sp. VKM F-4246]